MEALVAFLRQDYFTCMCTMLMTEIQHPVCATHYPCADSFSIKLLRIQMTGRNKGRNHYKSDVREITLFPVVDGATVYSFIFRTSKRH